MQKTPYLLRQERCRQIGLRNFKTASHGDQAALARLYQDVYVACFSGEALRVEALAERLITFGWVYMSRAGLLRLLRQAGYTIIQVARRPKAFVVKIEIQALDPWARIHTMAR